MVAPVHGGDVLAAAARWGLDPAAMLDFSANINPLGPPPGAIAAAREALDAIHHYPEPYARTLRKALAEKHGLPEEAILVGNGAAEVIHLLLRQAAGKTVRLPVPGFAEYRRAALAVGAVLSQETAQFEVICNPHNPTGRLLAPTEVLAHTAHVLLVDEAFIDLTDAGEEGSVIRQVLDRPGLVVIRSLTKFYAMPGLRVGYAAAAPDLIRMLDDYRDPWSVSPMASAAALAALNDTDYACRTREWVRTERPWLAAQLKQLGYRVTPPSANFILVEGTEPAWRLQERLGPRGILIRDCRSFEGLSESHMRLAVRSRPDNLQLLEALAHEALPGPTR